MFFKNKPWKEWKTRKTILVFTIFCACLYTVIGLYMNYNDKIIDSTLTVEVFNFLKWLVVSGGAITIAKTVKGKTNSDADEDYYNE